MAARLATTPCAKPANWQLRTTGKAGHSGGIFNDQMGSGAVYEISRIINEFQLTLREPNMTFHVGMLLGGANPKADPSGSGTTAQLTFENGYPPMAPTPGNKRFLQLFNESSRAAGILEAGEIHPMLRGAGAHAPGESVDVERIRRQAKRAALLIRRLAQ
ncbi:MAG: hypothetical protein EXQ57_06960 [Bryobacterales bacterium]|nr:hypothetical protein [Bryobacterales bacterium]